MITRAELGQGRTLLPGRAGMQQLHAHSSADAAPATRSASVLPWPRERASFLGLVFATSFALAHYAEVSSYGKAVLMLTLALAGAGLYCALWAPRFFPTLVVAYLPFSFYYPLPVSSVSGANMTNVLLLLGGVALLVSLKDRVGGPPFGPFEGVVVLYVLTGFLGFLQTLSVSSGGFLDLFLNYKRWLTPVLFYFVARGVLQTREDLAATLGTLLWTAALAAGLTWDAGRQMGGGRSLEEARVGGILGQPNTMGAFLAYYGLPFFAFFLVPGKWTRRLIALGGFLLTIRAALFTFSRGAYLAFIAGAGVLILVRNPLYFAGSAGLVVAASSVPGILPSSVQDRLGGTTTEDRDIYAPDSTSNLDDSSAKRLVLWRAGLEMVGDHPWRGIGLGRFGSIVDEYTEQPLSPTDPRDAHNAYLLTAAELGIPALVLMVLILVWPGLKALVLYLVRRDAFVRALCLCFLGSLPAVCVSCMFGSRFSDDSLVAGFWVLAAMLNSVPARRGAESS